MHGGRGRLRTRPSTARKAKRQARFLTFYLRPGRGRFTSLEVERVSRPSRPGPGTTRRPFRKSFRKLRSMTTVRSRSRTAPAPGRAPVRVTPPGSRACPRPPGQNGLRGGLPSPALPGSGPWGRRSAYCCPASQPSRRDSGYPAAGAVQLPRSPRRRWSGCTAPRTGAQGRKPGMHGPDVLAPANCAQSGQRAAEASGCRLGPVENRSISDSHAGCFPARLRAGRSIGPRSPAVRHISAPGLGH
jgi:hypothetical protein